MFLLLVLIFLSIQVKVKIQKYISTISEKFQIPLPKQKAAPPTFNIKLAPVPTDFQVAVPLKVSFTSTVPFTNTAKAIKV